MSLAIVSVQIWRKMKRMAAKFFVSLLMMPAIGEVANAQQDTTSPYPKVTIASPTAASLGKFTDIPVGYHTGVPQITIPIYTVKEGPLSLPINLSYHAGGIKVMEPASYVGTGWSLQAGGMISRVVRGAPDEAGTTGLGQYGHFSNYGFSNYLTYNSGTAAPNDQGFASAMLDGEPDLFTYNFNGYSGKFFFDDDRKPVIVDGEDLRIEYVFPRDTATSFTTKSSNIQGFIITVPSGVKYHFGITPGGNLAGAEAVETTFSFTGEPSRSDWLYTSWFLTRIVSADNLFGINLTYTSEKYSHYTLSMSPVDGNFSPGSWGSMPPVEYRLAKNYMEGVRLASVTASDCAISLVPGDLRTDLGNSYYTSASYNDLPNSEARTLGAVSISNNLGFCKKFSFYYSYFIAPGESLPGYVGNYTIDTDRYRLRLDSLRESSCDNALSIAPYKFIYSSSGLPRRLSFGQDHWGYANGVTSNNTLVPTYSINTYKFVQGANREPAWPAMQQGILEKIIYPTGGFTRYAYEPHRTWINTTRYSEVFRYSYGVGYDGNHQATYNNLVFSGNYYQVVKANGACPPNTSGCTAGATLVNGGASINLGGLAGNSRDTSFIQIPAGAYTLNMFRDATQTGTGAQYTFTEVVPQALQENAMVGGLRIKQIVQKENLVTVDSIKTTYDYNVNGRSSGILYSRPAYVQIVRNDIVKMFGVGNAYSGASSHPNTNGCLGPENAGTTQKYYKSACPIFPMAATQGNHIGYNEVRVRQSGNGYSVYRYYGSGVYDPVQDDIAYRNITPTVCNATIPNSPAAPLAYEYRRGQLKWEGHFSEANELLKDINYTMQYDSTQPTPAYMVSNVLGAIWGTKYELRGYRKTQTKVVTNTYVPLNGVTSQIEQTIYNESPWHNQATRKQTVNTVGDTQTVRIKYASDFRIANCDTISTGLPAYNSACSSCDATMYSANAGCTTISCLYWSWVNNALCRANARRAYITRRRTNFTNSNNAFGTCIANAKNAATASLKPVLHLQQGGVIVPIEQSTWRNGTVLNASFFAYDYMANPVTTPYLAKARQVNLATPSTVFATAQVASGSASIATDARYEDDATFKHEAGSLVQVTLRDGLSNAYVWDFSNTLPVAKVANAAPDQIAYSSFETNGYGGWTLNSGAGTITGGFTGAKSLSGGVNKNVPTGNYFVALWCIGNVYVNGQLQTQAPVKTLGSWKCYEVKLNGVSAVNVSGNQIDEVRLHPQGAMMTSYAYTPLVGIIGQVEADNEVTRYEYDALGRLQLVRNEEQQVLKQIDYQYQAPTHTNSIWQTTGVVRCKPCAANQAFETVMLQNQEKDVNPNSNSYESFRWVDAGVHSTCDALRYWQFTATAIRCKQNGGANTGEREREQRDMNPCSPSYNVTRWVVVDTNITACPLPPPPCNSSTCGANSQKCVSGVCETGVEVVVSSVYKKVAYQGGPFVWKWECTRKYCFSDGTSSTYSWLTWHDSPCSVGSCNVE